MIDFINNFFSEISWLSLRYTLRYTYDFATIKEIMKQNIIDQQNQKYL